VHQDAASLIVGADGAGSALRSALHDRGLLQSREESLAHDYKELHIPATAGGGWALEPHALHVWPRGGYMLIALPNPDRSFTATLFLPTHGTPGFITDFPGLTKESATWLGRKGIGMFGVEAVSPGRPGRNNFEVHHVCRDLGFTHMEGLVNLDKLVGKGRFRFIGFPIKIKGGTGAPIRAVAWLDG
jgi:kynurenine formamidase